jgi:hypothetical protein
MMEKILLFTAPLVLNATHRPEMLLSLAVVLGGVNLARD